MNNGMAMPFMTMVEGWGCRGRVELRGGHGGLGVIKVNQSEAKNTAQNSVCHFLQSDAHKVLVVMAARK